MVPDELVDLIYQAAEQPRLWERVMDAVLHMHGTRADVLSGHLQFDCGAFEPSEVARFEPAAAYVVRALQWQRQLSRARETAAALTHALNLFPQAVMLLEPDSTLIHANIAAMELLSCTGGALRIDRSRIVAVGSASDRSLSLAIVQAIRARQNLDRPPQIVRLADSAGTLAVMAVSPRGDPAGTQTVLLFASHSADRMQPDSVLIRDAFGLSPTEADIAASLAAGEAVEAISVRRQGKVATVRTQVKHLMRKLGVRRQSELASLLGRSVASLQRHRAEREKAPDRGA